MATGRAPASLRYNAGFFVANPLAPRVCRFLLAALSGRVYTQQLTNDARRLPGTWFGGEVLMVPFTRALGYLQIAWLA